MAASAVPNIKPLRDLVLVEILPRRDEVVDYEVRDGVFHDLAEVPAPASQVVAVRQWTGTNTASTLRYAGERNSPRLRRARVLSTGPKVSDVHVGDTILVGIFAGLETEMIDGKDLRFIAEREALLVEDAG